MNSKGMFCFLLVLAFATAEISMLKESSSAFGKIREAKLAAIEAEKAALTRTLMENSVDSVIEETLWEGIMLNQEPEEIKQEVNSRLALLFQKMQEEYSKGIKTGFKPESLDTQFLNENSSVYTAKTGKKSIAAEYSFNGGLMKQNSVTAEITGKRTKTLFKLPAGYTIRKTVVG